MEAQKPYMMSLYEYLGRAAGSELGKEVEEVAVKLRETIQEQEVSNPKYTGKVKLYRREFLDEYFGKKMEASGSDFFNYFGGPTEQIIVDAKLGTITPSGKGERYDPVLYQQPQVSEKLIEILK